MNNALGFLRSAARLPNLHRETSEKPPEHFDPTPIMITPRTRLIVLVAVAVALAWLALNAPSIPRLLMMGATFALVLSFPVRMLSRFMSRNLAILIVVGSMVALLLLTLVLLVPFLISEIGRFVEGLPNTVTSLQDTMRDVLTDLHRRGWVKDSPDTVLNNFETNLFERGQKITEQLLNNTVDTLTRSFSLLVTAFGVFFIATYLLVDVPRFQENFVKMFASRYRNDARQLWDTIGDSLSRYLGGLLISITFQGVAVMVGLYAIGIPFALILGIWMAATAILPFIGAFLGAIPAVLLAATMGWKITVATILLYVVVNQLDGNFVTPRVQGSALRVHPVLIFVSVIGGSELAGPFGAVMAVPTLAVLRVLAEFFWQRLRVDEEQEPLLVAMTGSELDIEVETDTDADGDTDERTRITITQEPAPAPRQPASASANRIILRSAPNTPVDPLGDG